MVTLLAKNPREPHAQKLNNTLNSNKMKRSKTWMLTAILFCGVVTGCVDKTGTAQANGDGKTNATDTVKSLPEYSYPEQSTYMSAICKYLTDSIGKNYSQGDVCIPCTFIVKADESNPDDIRVWGDYWVFNYKQAGDTLKNVSGGAHPGLFHLKKSGNDFIVNGFDGVADGSDYNPSAKKIFGEYFNDFSKINSDDKGRNEAIKKVISEYVKRNNLPFTCYQDYGWDPVKLD